MKTSKKTARCVQAATLSVLGLISLQTFAAGKDAKADPYMEENAREQANIKTVVAFYKGLANFDFDECRKYLGDYYIQHNPTVEDGPQGLQKALKSGRKILGPKAHSKVDHKVIVAEGDHVILLTHSVMVMDDLLGDDSPNRGNAVMDIFRLENGKIVEHWDTMQELPEKSRNTGMF